MSQEMNEALVADQAFRSGKTQGKAEYRRKVLKFLQGHCPATEIGRCKEKNKRLCVYCGLAKRLPR